MSYAALDRRAEALATRLRELGAGPGALVGVCLERSVDMLVGVLGVMKSGAAYVPLDPAFPAERLAFMLHDSRASILVTERALEGRGRRERVHGRGAGRPGGRRGDRPTADARAAGGRPTPDDLAYVLYTSGRPAGPRASRSRTAR